jgi:hypothetical protein
MGLWVDEGIPGHIEGYGHCRIPSSVWVQLSIVDVPLTEGSLNLLRRRIGIPGEPQGLSGFPHAHCKNLSEEGLNDSSAYRLRLVEFGYTFG